MILRLLQVGCKRVILEFGICVFFIIILMVCGCCLCLSIYFAFGKKLCSR